MPGTRRRVRADQAGTRSSAECAIPAQPRTCTHRALRRPPGEAPLAGPPYLQRVRAVVDPPPVTVMLSSPVRVTVLGSGGRPGLATVTTLPETA